MKEKFECMKYELEELKKYRSARTSKIVASALQALLGVVGIAIQIAAFSPKNLITPLPFVGSLLTLTSVMIIMRELKERKKVSMDIKEKELEIDQIRDDKELDGRFR